MEEIEVTDMHTGGENVRIITSGFPTISGKTILEKRRYIRSNMDHIRQRLMHEPRGHQEQYGALLVDADGPECDIGVIFMHNGGYSVMCGHASIALGRYVVDNNLHKNKEIFDEKYVKVVLQCPCGVVNMKVEINDGKSGSCSFVSIPAFCFAQNLKVATKSFGTLTVDIGYGGTFYALIDLSQTNMSFEQNSSEDWRRFADEVTRTMNSQVQLHHPLIEDLSFLYGVIVTDGKDSFSTEPTENICIFGEKRQIDRSPTGSGVTARLAVQYAKKQIEFGATRTFRNALTKSEFLGKVVEETSCGDFRAVRVEVTGHAYYCSKSTLFAEEDDPFKNGFSLS